MNMLLMLIYAAVATCVLALIIRTIMWVKDKRGESAAMFVGMLLATFAGLCAGVTT